MAGRVKNLRIAAFARQAGRCWYCGCNMILGSTQSIRQCTAEHLVARSEGGRSNASNIVAACRFCNQTRHKRKRALAADCFKLLVQQRLSKGKWHQLVFQT